MTDALTKLTEKLTGICLNDICKVCGHDAGYHYPMVILAYETKVTYCREKRCECKQFELETTKL